MAYHKPFTPQQRLEAKVAYVSYRDHYKKLRDEYPPKTSGQRDVLKRYREVLREIKEQLLTRATSVNVKKLNEGDALTRWLAVEYLSLCLDADAGDDNA